MSMVKNRPRHSNVWVCHLVLIYQVWHRRDGFCAKFLEVINVSILICNHALRVIEHPLSVIDDELIFEYRN